jgi:hypothetical protein
VGKQALLESCGWHGMFEPKLLEAGQGLDGYS